MKNFGLWALYASCMVSFPVSAQGILNSHQSVDIKASISTVWDAVKDFDGLHKWHPMLFYDVIKSGANGKIGSVRTLTLRDGPNLDEELLSFDPVDRKFGYRLIDPLPVPSSSADIARCAGFTYTVSHLAPLPVAEYVATVQVVEGKPGYATVLWRSSFRNNSDSKMTDDEVIGFINGVYRTGLDNLKAMLEAKGTQLPIKQ